jgi:hypothetical protein
VRLHDSFYLRMGLGVGYGRVTSEGEIDGESSEATYDGWGPAFELLIGGTLGKGWVLGGGLVGQDISNPSVTASGGEGTDVDYVQLDDALGVGALGPFVDWFPDPGGGFHAGAMLGFAVIGLSNPEGNHELGPAGSLWAGYDFWIASQWSLGVEGRAVTGRASRTFEYDWLLGSRVEGEFEDYGTTYEILFTALYH